MLRQKVLFLFILSLFCGFSFISAAQTENQAPNPENCFNANLRADLIQASCTAWLATAPSSAARRPQAYFQRALAARQQNRRDDALADINSLLGLAPDMWPAYWVKATWLNWRRDYAGGIAAMDQVIAREPSLAVAYALRAAAADNLGRFDAAQQDIDRALELATGKAEQADFLKTRGLIHEGRGDYPAAKAAFEGSLELRPEAIDSRYGLARVQLLDGDYDAARRTLNDVKQRAPNNAYVDLWRFVAAVRSGRNAAAEISNLESTIDPSRWPVRLLKQLLGQGQADPAAQNPEDADWPKDVITAGNRAEADFYLGQAALAKGDRRLAASHFERVIAAGFEEYIEHRAAKVELRRLQAAGIVRSGS